MPLFPEELCLGGVACLLPPVLFLSARQERNHSSVLVQQPSWNRTESCHHRLAHTPPALTQSGQAKPAAFHMCLSRNSLGTVHKKDGTEGEWLLYHIPEPQAWLPLQARALILRSGVPAKPKLRESFH